MTVTRKSIFTMSMPYTVATVRLGGREQIVAATEDHGKTILTSPPQWRASELLPGPGGCMSIAQPSGSERMFAIYGCFPGYQFHDAAVYEILPTKESEAGASPYELRTVFPLPFAHRICFATRNGTEYLISANLALTKKGADDWTEPGTVYAAPIPESPDGQWKPEPILRDLHKNHCMYSGSLHGRRVLMVGGQEGLFSFDLDAAGDGWNAERILDHEISEVVAIDLDGDGIDELVTIEPFHGSRLFVYRATDNGWMRVSEYPLQYGHGVFGGTIAGKTALVVGNRAGNKNLEILVPTGGSDLTLSGHVVAEGVGSANVALMEHAGATWIVATNQADSEVTAYRIDDL